MLGEAGFWKLDLTFLKEMEIRIFLLCVYVSSCHLAWLASLFLGELLISASSALGLQVMVTFIWHLCGSGDLNSGPQTYRASALPAGLSLQLKER